MSLSASRKARWSLEKVPHFQILLITLFFGLGLIGILNHAMWRDELNGWLIAQYSPNLGTFWQNIRYEGHPILWYAFLYLLNQITANPVAMQLFHLGLATASTSLFVCYAPFTRLQKLLFVLGYLPLYEYLVISRNYAIAVLILWAICVYFPTRQKNYLILAILLALLANTNAYALLISLSLSFSLMLEFLLRHPLKLELKASSFNRSISLLIILVGVMLAVALLIPPTDSNLQGGADQWFFNWDFHRFNQSLSRIWNSYILVLVPGDAKPLDVFLFAILSIGIFSFCVTFFWDYPIILTFYSCGTSSILLFTYLKFLGSARHYGHLYLILITALWLKNYYSPNLLLNPFKNIGQSLEVGRIPPAPLDQGSESSGDNQGGENSGNYKGGETNHFIKKLSRWQAWVKRHFFTFLMILLYCQLVSGLVGYIRDLTLPYSASRATARYLQVHQLNQFSLIGSEDFTMTPISGYLGQKIYYPESQKMGSFVLFNRQRQPVNDLEILQQVQAKLKESSPIVLILNHPLETSLPSLKIKPVEKFTHSFIGNEQYYLYLIQ
ncbi:MAG: hypothetical protein VKL42_05360 [Snowella sp.]|nr:hypothetical protein [Snowella sp.]